MNAVCLESSKRAPELLTVSVLVNLQQLPVRAELYVGAVVNDT